MGASVVKGELRSGPWGIWGSARGLAILVASGGLGGLGTLRKSRGTVGSLGDLGKSRGTVGSLGGLGKSGRNSGSLEVPLGV